MARYTITDLRDYVKNVNGWMAEINSDIRFETNGRNGYQAVDQYRVDENGDRIGSGVDRNVATGSSRECSNALSDHYGHLYRTHVEEARKRASIRVLLFDADRDIVATDVFDSVESADDFLVAHSFESAEFSRILEK